MCLAVSYKGAFLKFLKKGVGSGVGSGSGSIRERYKSANPDPHKMSRIPNTALFPCQKRKRWEWWRRLTWGHCSRCRWGRPCASRVGSGSRSISQRYLRIRTKMSRIPNNTLLYSMPKAVGCRGWRRLTWGRCSRCRWGRPCASWRAWARGRWRGSPPARTTRRFPACSPAWRPDLIHIDFENTVPNCMRSYRPQIRKPDMDPDL